MIRITLFTFSTLLIVSSAFINPIFTFKSKNYMKSSNNINNVEDINSFIDLNTLNNEIPSNYLYKKILKKGNNEKVHDKDTVFINWSITLISNGKCVANADDFEFMIGTNPREVIKGWEILIKDMTVGEQCEAIIKSEYAFTDKGLEDLVPPNENIRCKLTLKQIIPAINRSYKSVDDNEDISMKEKVARQMSNRASELNSDIFKEEEEKEKENEEDKYIFKPTNTDFETHVQQKDKEHEKMKQDDRNSNTNTDTTTTIESTTGAGARMVSGQNSDYTWTETDEELEVSIPLHRDVDEVAVEFKKESILILSKNTGDVILEGPLEQAVVPSECSWLISENDDDSYSDGNSDGSGDGNSDKTTNEETGLRTLHLCLVKGYHSKNIWNSFLNRKYLQEKQ